MNLTNASALTTLMNSVLAPTGRVGESISGDDNGAKASVDFGAALKASLDRIDGAQKKADNLARSFEIGDNDVELHDVMLSLQKANIDLQTAVQVRNRIVSAYQSIMSMSI